MKRGFTSPRGRWRPFSAGRHPSHLHLHLAGRGGVVVHHHRGAMRRSDPCHADCPEVRVRRDRSHRSRDAGCPGAHRDRGDESHPRLIHGRVGRRTRRARRPGPVDGSRRRKELRGRAGARSGRARGHDPARPGLRSRRALLHDPAAGSPPRARVPAKVGARSRHGRSLERGVRARPRARVRAKVGARTGCALPHDPAAGTRSPAKLRVGRGRHAEPGILPCPLRSGHRPPSRDRRTSGDRDRDEAWGPRRPRAGGECRTRAHHRRCGSSVRPFLRREMRDRRTGAGRDPVAGIHGGPRRARARPVGARRLRRDRSEACRRGPAPRTGVRRPPCPPRRAPRRRPRPGRAGVAVGRVRAR